MRLYNLHELLFSLSPWNWIINLIKGRILVTTLPPISTEGLSTNDVEELMEKTRKAMNEVFHATSREIQLSLSGKPYDEWSLSDMLYLTSDLVFYKRVN